MRIGYGSILVVSLFGVASLIGVALAVAAGQDPLAQHRWRSRVLVVSAPDAADRRLAGQRTVVAADRSGFEERDLVVIEAVGADRTASDVRRRLGLPTTTFRAVLLGKDGGTKLVSPEPITADRLFSTIDAMPMRRDEIGRRP